MVAAPRGAPSYESAGVHWGGSNVQRYAEGNHDDQNGLLSGSAISYRPKRRKRTRSHDLGAPEENRRSRGGKILSGLLLVVVWFAAILAWSRRPSLVGETEPELGLVGAEIDSNDYEEERLRREVEELEDTLLRKKAMLGIAPGLPLQDAQDSGAGGEGNIIQAKDGDAVAGGDWSSRYTAAVGGGQRPQWQHQDRRQEHQPQEQHQEQQRPQYRQQELLQHELPSVPRGSLAGDPMFGSLMAPPVRPSVESQPNLIREPVPLVVGGSDGSGTRGVVALLERLKVPMVVEDRGTMDVHGAPYMAKGGWPAVVRPVIAWSRGAAYESRAAPNALRKTTVDALGNLRVQMQKLANKLPRPRNGEGVARYVSWGLKAPVSMVLVPFFELAWGRVKFLHVVRDGRDIAFSGNQTPVEKFYTDVFPKGSRESELQKDALKAMALWNNWNLGVYRWASSQKEKGAPGVDYLLLHTEDLIDPPAKFAAIKDVAEFVGSPLSDFDLCCIATEGSKDMGSHTKLRKEQGHINSRFGKWKSKVEGDPQLSRLLHAEGEGGLRTFGYEPERSLRVSAGFECAPERDPTCPQPPAGPRSIRSPRGKNVKTIAKVSPRVTDTATCVGLKNDVDFRGFDLQVVHTEGHLACCQECRSVHDCSYFTYDYGLHLCYLKSQKGTEIATNGLVSGMGLVP